MHITHSHLLSYIVLVHLRIDLQVLVSSAGKSRPGYGHLLSFVRVPVNINREKGI